MCDTDTICRGRKMVTPLQDGSRVSPWSSPCVNQAFCSCDQPGRSGATNPGDCQVQPLRGDRAEDNKLGWKIPYFAGV